MNYDEDVVMFIQAGQHKEGYCERCDEPVDGKVLCNRCLRVIGPGVAKRMAAEYGWTGG